MNNYIGQLTGHIKSDFFFSQTRHVIWDGGSTMWL